MGTQSEPSIDSFENVKLHAAPNHLLGEIDIEERVMRRIAGKQAGAASQSRIGASANPNRRENRPTRKLPVYAAVACLLLLTAATVYAASERLEIRNRDGVLKIQTIPSENPIVVITAEPVIPSAAEQYRREVVSMLKPGQLLAYYVRDGSSDPSIKFQHDNRMPTYEEYRQLALRTGAPVIKEPSHLPDGLAFQYGEVDPLLPNEHDPRTSSEFSRLKELFRERAAAEPDRKLFVEEAAWSSSNHSKLMYSYNGSQLYITALQGGIMMEGSVSPDEKQETLKVGDNEAIIVSGSEAIVISGSESIIVGDSEFDHSYYSAMWYDESNDTHYWMRLSGGALELTEPMFKRIVTSMLTG